MRKTCTILAALAAIALAPATALANGKAVEEKNVLSGKASLDPEMGYIFLHADNRTNGMFLRMPDDSTRAEYLTDWEEAFAKEEKKYPDKLRRWEIDVAIARQTKSAPPEKPLPPDRETFSVGAIELRDVVSYGPQFVFSKGERFSYLTEVKPGTYIYYGPIFYGPGLVPAGSCYCMGSVKFEVKAGVVTDLGNSLIASPRREPPYDVGTQVMLKMEEDRIAKGKSSILPTQDVAYGVPESLKDWPVVQAELHASGKINNFYGINVNRMPPIPGVLAYRRDTVIDVQTGEDLPNPALQAQVRIKD